MSTTVTAPATTVTAGSIGVKWWMTPEADERLNNVWAWEATRRMYASQFTDEHTSRCDFKERLISINPVRHRYRVAVTKQWAGHPITTEEQFDIMLARALTMHEVMHVLFTDPSRVVWVNALHGTLTNMLEDERGERCAVRYLPAWAADIEQLGACFYAKGRHYWNNKLTAEDLVASTVLFERWNNDAVRRGDKDMIAQPDWFTSKVVPMGSPDSARARELWETQVRPLVHLAWEAKSTFDAAAIAYRIMCILWPDPKDPDKTSLSVPGARDKAGRIMAGNPDLEGATNGNIPDDKEFQEKGKDKGKGKEGDQRLPGDSPEDEGDGDGDDTGHFQRVEDGTVEKQEAGEGSGGRGMTPETDLEVENKILGELPDATGKTLSGGDMVPVLKDARPLVKRIGKILQVPTEDAAPTPSDKRGQFSVANLIKTRGEKPLAHFDKRGYSPRGMAVGVVIDGSGSMGLPTHPGNAMYHVVRAMLALERACATEGVKLQAGLAGGDYIKEAPAKRPLVPVVDLTNPGRTEEIHNVVRWFKTFDGPMNSRVTLAQIAGLRGGGANESVSASLRIIHKMLLDRPEPTKLIISIHDGQPTDETRENVKATADALRKMGANIMSIGIAPKAPGEIMDEENYYVKDMRNNLETMFGKEPERTLMVPDIEQLPQKLGYAINRYRK